MLDESHSLCQQYQGFLAYIAAHQLLLAEKRRKKVILTKIYKGTTLDSE